MQKNSSGSGDDSSGKRSCANQRSSALRHPLILRTMREDDVGEVMAIEEHARAARWNKAAFMEEVCNPRSLVLVAESRGAVVGYLCASLVLDEGHILNLSVHPRYRRRGIAKRLIHHMLSRMAHHGCKHVFLEVRISNRTAITMYEQLYFLPVGRRREYYRNPAEDALVMRCSIHAETTTYCGHAAKR